MIISIIAFPPFKNLFEGKNAEEKIKRRHPGRLFHLVTASLKRRLFEEFSFDIFSEIFFFTEFHTCRITTSLALETPILLQLPECPLVVVFLYLCRCMGMTVRADFSTFQPCLLWHACDRPNYLVN